MREVITEINRVDDPENDFTVQLSADLSTRQNQEELQRGNYIDNTQYIMKVINSLIEMTQDNSEDARERTIFQKFKEFNQHLFWVTQSKDFQHFGNLNEGASHQIDSAEAK